MMRFGPVMLAFESEWPGLQSRGPETDGSSPVVMYVCVEDVDRTVERAVAAGARILRPLENQLWGDRIGWLADPQGHVWTVARALSKQLRRSYKDGGLRCCGNPKPRDENAIASQIGLNRVMISSYWVSRFPRRAFWPPFAAFERTSATCRQEGRA